jgi:hypothetical protein
MTEKWSQTFLLFTGWFEIYKTWGLRIFFSSNNGGDNFFFWEKKNEWLDKFPFAATGNRVNTSNSF